MSREYTLDALLYIWDFFLSGVTEKDREILEEAQRKSDVSASFYSHNDYFQSGPQSDSLINLDYICVAMLCSVKENLLKEDQMGCLQILLNLPKMQTYAESLSIAQRVADKLEDVSKVKQIEIVEKERFPSILEEKMEKMGYKTPSAQLSLEMSLAEAASTKGIKEVKPEEEEDASF